MAYKKVNKVKYKRFRGLTTATNQLSVLPYVPLIRLAMPIKQQFSLSSTCYMLLFIVLDLYSHNIPATASRLTKDLYGEYSCMRGLYFRLDTLIAKGLIRKVDNHYYLTDTAIQALSNVKVD